MNAVAVMILSTALFLGVPIGLHFIQRPPRLPRDVTGPLPPIAVIEAHIDGLKGSIDDGDSAAQRAETRRNLRKWRRMLRVAKHMERS